MFPDVSKLFHCKVEIMHNIAYIYKLDKIIDKILRSVAYYTYSVAPVAQR